MFFLAMVRGENIIITRGEGTVVFHNKIQRSLLGKLIKILFNNDELRSKNNFVLITSHII